MNTIFNWLLDRVKDYVIRNWKTTLIGVLGAVLSRYIPDITEEQRQAILAAVVAGVGLFSKDGSTTGTTAQPRESVQPGSGEPVAAPVPDAVIQAEAARIEQIQTGP
jgi:hypothetical protein